MYNLKKIIIQFMSNMRRQGKQPYLEYNDSIMFSIEPVLIYILTNSIEMFPFLHTFYSIYYL